MPKLTYFPLLIDRWIAGVQELTFEERGFYISLLVWLYDTGKPIKDGDHAARILRCDKRTSRRLLGKLRPKFRLTSDGLRHRLCDELLRNGGKIRGLQGINFPTDPDPDPEEEKRKKSNQKKAQPSAAPVVPVGLDLESWEAYEKHRRENRHKVLKPDSITRLMRWLVKQPDQAAVVDQTIRNGWTGLFELKTNGSNGNGRDYEPKADRIKRQRRERYENRHVDPGEDDWLLGVNVVDISSVDR